PHRIQQQFARFEAPRRIRRRFVPFERPAVGQRVFPPATARDDGAEDGREYSAPEAAVHRGSPSRPEHFIADEERPPNHTLKLTTGAPSPWRLPDRERTCSRDGMISYARLLPALLLAGCATPAAPTPICAQTTDLPGTYACSGECVVTTDAGSVQRVTG